MANIQSIITNGNGNVLINTTTDSGFKLDVNGTGRFSGQVRFGTGLYIETNGDFYQPFTGQIQISGAAGNTTYPSYGFYGDTGIGMYRESADTLAFVTSGVKALTIASTGAATFAGLIDAGGRLKVSGGATDQYYFEGARTGVGVTYRLYDNANNIYHDSWSSQVFRLNQNGGSGGNLIVTGGNILMGTTSGTRFLTVAPSTGACVAAFMSNSATGGIELQSSTTSASGWVRVEARGDDLDLVAGLNSSASLLSTGQLKLYQYGASGGFSGSPYKMLAVDSSGNVISETLPSGGTVTSVSGTGTVSGLTLTGTVTSSGNLTLGGTLTLTSGNITTGLGFTPYNATNPAGYTANTGTVTSVAATPGSGISISGSPITTLGTLIITNTDLGSQQAIFKNVAVSGQTAIQADTNNDTLTFVNGSGIAMTTAASTDELTVTNTDLGSSQNIFKNVAVSGQSTVVADTNNDTLTLVAGTGLAITTNALSDTITFSPKMNVLVNSSINQSTNVSTSWYYLPMATAGFSTTKQYYDTLTAPFTGYIRTMNLRGTGNGTTTSATTIQLQVLKNGTAVYTSGVSNLAGSGSSKYFSISLTSAQATFSQTDRLEFQFKTNSPLYNMAFSFILQES